MRGSASIDDTQWQQVLSRDARSDGKFVYGVRSTHIYCRPTCPSRRPRRSNVDVFAQPDAAEAAGFRACKRCLPSSAHPQLQIIEAACRYIDAHLDHAITLASVSKHSGYSPFYLQRLFRKVLGMSPLEYRSAKRMEQFKKELLAGRSIAEAVYRAGYGSSSRLYDHANLQLGMTPSAYRHKGRDVEVVYGVFPHIAGKLLLVVSALGICRVELGPDDDRGIHSLRQEFSAAVIERNEKVLAPLAAPLLAFLEENVLATNLPPAILSAALTHLACSNFRKSLPPR